jgi:PAS domain-containing protein
MTAVDDAPLPIRILHLEDDHDDRQLVAGTLRAAGRIIDWNERAEQMFGWLEESARG